MGAGEADGVGLQRKGAPDRGKKVVRGYPETVSRPWGSINMQKRLGQQQVDRWSRRLAGEPAGANQS